LYHHGKSQLNRTRLSGSPGGDNPRKPWVEDGKATGGHNFKALSESDLGLGKVWETGTPYVRRFTSVHEYVGSSIARSDWHDGSVSLSNLSGRDVNMSTRAGRE